jgi:hypothetical protein
MPATDWQLLLLNVMLAEVALIKFHHRQLDIASHKKVIVCEYCGRIMVDKDINQVQE